MSTHQVVPALHPHPVVFVEAARTMIGEGGYFGGSSRDVI